MLPTTPEFRKLARAELPSARRLWYAVFCQELNQETYADHVTGEFEDGVRGPQHLFGAFVNGALVATARLTLRREASFIHDERYGLSVLRSQVAPRAEVDSFFARVALLSRLAVAQAYRGRGLGRAMVSLVIRESLKHGADLLLVVPQAGREDQWLQRGFRHYGVTHHGRWVDPRVLDLGTEVVSRGAAPNRPRTQG